MEVREPDARYLIAVQRTELGELPGDWRVVRLSDIATVTSGKRLPLGKSLTTSETPHPYIRVSDMERGTVNATAIQFVPVDVFPKIQQYRIFSTDLYISVAGTLGLVGQVPSALDGANLTENANRISGIRGSKAYLYQVLASPLVQTVIESERTVGAQPKLALGRIRNFSIPLPPTSEEQAAIGGALADADALIDSLEQLLTKKRQIKQGAMQELLTGKRRLPGFTGEWADCTLQKLADIRSGGTPSTRRAEFWDGAIPWCTPTDITALAGAKHISETERSISDKGQKASSAEMLPAGTIVMTSRATIGECAIASVPLTTNQGFKNFVPRDTTCGEFLYYLLGTQRSAFLTLCSGSTFLEIGKRQLEDFIVRCPIEYDEQLAIAEVLSSIDKEITTLEARLTKARALKQAMAQALLTGRIRLVEPNA